MMHHTDIDSPKNIKNVLFEKIDILLKIGVLLSLTLCLLTPDNSLKIFTTCAVLSIPVIGKNWNHLITNKKDLILPGMLLLFGLVQLIWVDVFKETGSDFSGAYRSYQNNGKVMVFATLIFLALQTSRLCALKNNIIQYWVIITAIILYCSAGYQVSVADNPLNYRVELGFEHATGTAYILTLVALLASQAIINLNHKKTVFFYLLHFAISFSMIIFTQTRAAMLVYPILSVGLFCIHYRKNRSVLLYSLPSFVIIILLVTTILNPVIEKRYQNVVTDLDSYSANNSNTSIGARFAMQQVGFNAGIHHLLGQSLEQRNTEALLFSQQNPSVKGALKYLNVHLHNEIIDTFSLKGIPGLIALAFLYLSMLFTACVKRDPLLFIVTLAIGTYGLSDVLLYAKSESLGCMVVLCATTLMMRKNSVKG